MQVGAGEPDQLGDPQSGLHGQVEHRVIAPTSRAGRVAGREQRLHLGFGEVGDHGPVVAFLRDRQHPGDALRVFGVLQRGVTEQRVDRGQAGVAGPDAVAALLFEVIEEPGDERGVELGQVEARWWSAGVFGGVGEQQSARCRGRRRRCAGWLGAVGSAGR